MIRLTVIAIVAATCGCAMELPVGCELVHERTVTAPGEPTQCTRYFVTKGGDESCLRLASSNECECDAEIVVHGGTQVEYLLNWSAGEVRMDWERADCSGSQDALVEGTGD